MKWMLVAHIRQWYVFFTVGIFLVIVMISGLLQPIFGSIPQSNKINPISQGNLAEPKIALACNVFWGEEFLPEMLTTLANNNIKITFFIGGSWAKRYPEMVAEIANQGHEIGNHSYSHPHPNSLSKDKNKEEIVRTEELIKEISGVKTKLYAPPYGEYNDIVLTAADELGYQTIMWSIDTVDWKRPPAEIIKNRVLKKLHNGAIILIHPTESTVQALPDLINQIQTKGYNISTVSDIL